MFRRPKPWYYRLMHSYAFLLLIWLFTGFALGTLILLFPLRWWVDYVRQNDLSHTVENAGVVVMMLLLAALSFILSFKIFRWHTTQRKTLITVVAVLIPFFCAAAALALFMNPDYINAGTETNQVSQQFVIGPYPTKSKITQLKEEGYTGIISLLHPAVVPFEPSLLKDEESAAKESGIELIKAPMLPWVGENTSSLKKIEAIAKTGKGKYYIHCYLGKDRVNVVKNLIAKVTGNSSGIENKKSTSRTFEKQKVFERGEIYKLDEGVYMTPFPTNEELLAFFLAGQLQTVVNLMDSTEAESKPWIITEHRELDNAGITFKLLPAKRFEMSRVIDSIISFKKPLVIHSWKTNTSSAQNFRKAFSNRTGKAAINLATNAAETY